MLEAAAGIAAQYRESAESLKREVRTRRTTGPR